MRLAFWRDAKAWLSTPKAIKARIFAAVPVASVKRRAPPFVEPVMVGSQPVAPQLGDVDLRALWAALRRKRMWVILPTLVVAVGSLVAVNLVTPRYKSEARILIDGRENIFLRPNGERNDDRTALDAEAVTSQVQLLLSRDLARDVIKKNNLAERPEFDPVLQGVSPIKSLLALVGIGRDPFSMTPEERVLDAYFDRLTAYAVDKSRVVVIEFQSRDPDLAAKVANSIADSFVAMQQAARQEQARSAGQWLSVEIDSLRKKVADAESHAEEFRSKSNLFIGSNNTSLSNQQLGEINTQLNNARALQSDAQSKARLIREMLQSGKPIEASEVLNSELIRRLAEQRVTLRAQLAEQSSTLLPQHPRIKELKAQLADLDTQIREEAGKISRSLENDAKIAGGRVDGLTSNLDQLKRQATSSNGQDVQLRALEREAKAQRDLLESYLAKYREATTRENIDAAPSDGRIISRSIVSNTPAYPKKLPIFLIATLATLMLTSGGIVTGELLRMTAPKPGVRVIEDQLPVAVEVPVQQVAAYEVPVAPSRVPETIIPVVEAAPSVVAPEPVAEPAPAIDNAVRETHPELVTGVSEIEQLAKNLRAAGDAARKVTLLGTGQNDKITLTALTLARLLARSAKVVLVDLSASSPVLDAVSDDPSAPGLAELMLGQATFGQVITKDKLSRVHMVSAGRAGADRTLLQSPRLTMALDALMRVYEHVVLDAGTAADLPAGLLTTHAQAVVVPEPSMSEEARHVMSAQLKAVGFSEVTMLSRPSTPNDVSARGAAVAAA